MPLKVKALTPTIYSNLYFVKLVKLVPFLPRILFLERLWFRLAKEEFVQDLEGRSATVPFFFQGLCKYSEGPGCVQQLLGVSPSPLLHVYFFLDTRPTAAQSHLQMLVCGHPEVEAVHRLQFSIDSTGSSSQSHPSSCTCLAPRSPLQALVCSPSTGLVSDSSLNQSPLPGCYSPKSSHNCIKSKSHRKALIPKYNGSASLSETGLMQCTKPKGVRPYLVLSLPRMFSLQRVTVLTF